METLDHIYEHNTWANRALIEACRSLEDKILDETLDGTYGSIRSTLRHIVSAQERYASILGKRSPIEDASWQDDEFPGFDSLIEHSDRTGAELQKLAHEVGEKKFEREFGGKRYEIMGKVVLNQVINHATEHRSQIMTIMTQCGVEPPYLDGWSHGFESGAMVNPSSD